MNTIVKLSLCAIFPILTAPTVVACSGAQGDAVDEQASAGSFWDKLNYMHCAGATFDKRSEKYTGWKGCTADAQCGKDQVCDVTAGCCVGKIDPTDPAKTRPVSTVSKGPFTRFKVDPCPPKGGKCPDPRPGNDTYPNGSNWCIDDGDLKAQAAKGKPVSKIVGVDNFPAQHCLYAAVWKDATQVKSPVTSKNPDPNCKNPYEGGGLNVDDNHVYWCPGKPNFALVEDTCTGGNAKTSAAIVEAAEKVTPSDPPKDGGAGGGVNKTLRTCGVMYADGKRATILEEIQLATDTGTYALEVGAAATIGSNGSGASITLPTEIQRSPVTWARVEVSNGTLEVMAMSSSGVIVDGAAIALEHQAAVPAGHTLNIGGHAIVPTYLCALN
jgi:hypothetical protein